MSSDLYFQKSGEQDSNLIILHGLFGSSKNWVSAANLLSKNHTVYNIDLRNHGQSPHFLSHTIEDLTSDLFNFINFHEIKKPILIGHSMGGMCAMSFALNYPELISALVVVDIAPRKYLPHHEKEFKALEMDITLFKSRSQLNEAMLKVYPNKEVLQFLQMNIERNSNQGYKWKLNVPVLKAANFTNEAYFTGQYLGPTLFIKGSTSNYILDTDQSIIRTFFPSSNIDSISGAGHWLHYSHQTQFLETFSRFLNSN